MNDFVVNIKNDNITPTLHLTDDQKVAHDELLDFIKSNYNPKDYKRALCGAAGTGKTFLVKQIIRDCGISYSSIGLSAPTHKACRILSESIGIGSIKINTLQSDLGLKLNFNVDNFDIKNPPFDPKGKIKIENCKLYIVDEASMINKGLCKFLEDICIKNACKLIYIGDSYQLPAPKDKYISAFNNIKIYHLKQIVRQEDDNPVKTLLTILRQDIDNKTFNFISTILKVKEKFDDGNTKGFMLCNESQFNKLLKTYFSDETLTKNIDFVKVIAYTNSVVSYWNKAIRQSIIKDAERSVVTNNDLFLSYTTIVNLFNDCVIKNSEEYIIKEVVNYTHPKYNIKGFMVRFQAIHGGNISTPLFIVDHSDKFSISVYLKTLNELKSSAERSTGNIRSQRWRDYFKFREECLILSNISDGNTIIANRSLDYGFALTSHKSQGSTFDTVFVDVHDILYDKDGNLYTDLDNVKRRLYVACSRCKNKLYMKL